MEFQFQKIDHVVNYNKIDNMSASGGGHKLINCLFYQQYKIFEKFLSIICFRKDIICPCHVIDSPRSDR